MEFKVLYRDSRTNARIGLVRTAHGEFTTPVYAPVGTRGAVKGILPHFMKEVGVELILSNTYHLLLRPGVDIIEAAGGVHRFVGWDGPILTDSGGFQIFSLAELRNVDDEGVTFVSYVDGSIIRLTPEIVVEIQNRLGADIIMCFDEPVAIPVSFDEAARATERTIRWAEMCKDAHDRDDQAIFAIVQGALFPELRENCLRRLVSMDFDGYALGGLSVGECFEDRIRIVREFAPLLPPEKPRYLMGVGTPLDVVLSIANGVDIFDCVIPTRNGRNGYAFTSKGPVRIRNEKYKFDFGPVDEGCNCYCCRNFSRSYIRHLFNISEMLGPILLSIHNIAFFQRLIRQIREAIFSGNLPELIDNIQNIWLTEAKEKDTAHRGDDNNINSDEEENNE